MFHYDFLICTYIERYKILCVMYYSRATSDVVSAHFAIHRGLTA